MAGIIVRRTSTPAIKSRRNNNKTKITWSLAHLQAFLGSCADAVVLVVVLLQVTAPFDVLDLGDVGLELGQLRQLELFHHLEKRNSRKTSPATTKLIPLVPYQAWYCQKYPTELSNTWSLKLILMPCMAVVV